MSSTTPLGAVGRGVLAGAAGTAAMTAWQTLSSRLLASGNSGGGKRHDAKIRGRALPRRRRSRSG